MSSSNPSDLSDLQNSSVLQRGAAGIRNVMDHDPVYFLQRSLRSGILIRSQKIHFYILRHLYICRVHLFSPGKFLRHEHRCRDHGDHDHGRQTPKIIRRIRSCFLRLPVLFPPESALLDLISVCHHVLRLSPVGTLMPA